MKLQLKCILLAQQKEQKERLGVQLLDDLPCVVRFVCDVAKKKIKERKKRNVRLEQTLNKQPLVSARLSVLPYCLVLYVVYSSAFLSTSQAI